jgi:hypothetical protein
MTRVIMLLKVFKPTTGTEISVKIKCGVNIVMGKKINDRQDMHIE